MDFKERHERDIERFLTAGNPSWAERYANKDDDKNSKVLTDYFFTRFKDRKLKNIVLGAVFGGVALGIAQIVPPSGNYNDAETALSLLSMVPFTYSLREALLLTSAYLNTRALEEKAKDVLESYRKSSKDLSSV